MRPVLLQMDGFGTYREPTTVDFAGADYFALTGPTGSGKSTVIDAITFALYGSVPRWDDRRVVTYALAPTASRGTVRLVFDVSGQRYVIARELRRSKAGAVTVANVRLERLLDPAGLGEVGEPTESLAADREATPYIERLLGLSFENFCTCVVLPQGDFATFLHARPAERQRILTKLLGLDVYEAIGRAAGVEASTAQSHIALLDRQLEEYAAATPTAVVVAANRAAALVEVVTEVEARVGSLTSAAAEVRAATAAVERLDREAALLGELKLPDELPALSDRRRLSHDALTSARAQAAEAETEQQAARAALAAAPAREPLEQARRDHHALATATADLPGAESQHAEAATALSAASAATVQARQQVEQARTQRDAAATEAAQTDAQLQQLTAERDRLAGLPPLGAQAQLAVRRSEAAAALESTRAAMAEAEEADATARHHLENAPDRASLAQASKAYADLAVARADLPALDESLRVAVAGQQEAAALVSLRQQQLRRAQAARSDAGRANTAAELRQHLAAGDACPVCTQEVATLPPELPTTELSVADAAVISAEDDLVAAQAAATDAAVASQRAESERDTAIKRIDQLLDLLKGVPDADTVTGQLTELDRVEAAVTAAAEQLRHALREHDEARTELDAVHADFDKVELAFQTARDPLVPLGPPEPGGDVIADWTRLSQWASAEATVRERGLDKLAAAAPAAQAAAAVQDQAVIDAARTETECRNAETLATRTEQQAATRLEGLTAQIDRLSAVLTTAPSQEETIERLEQLNVLAAAAQAAEDTLTERRHQLTEAEAAAADLDSEMQSAAHALHAARDRVVSLGAPPVQADDVFGSWRALTNWAAEEVANRIGQRATAEQSVFDAQARCDQAEHQLRDVLVSHEIGYPADRPLAESAVPAAARAVERARAAHETIKTDLARADKARQDQAEAQVQVQVATELARLLRSDRFPRWLVTSAVDGLVADAARSLYQLSGGQFELSYDNGGFLIVDHTDADSCRPVKTLSGGETFQASLALALALSTQMSALAVDGAARLDSIFLDEGFGTLDESTVDVVAATLEALAAGGDRMVGIVTHVTALADRVPTRFTVSKDARTSAVVREDR